MPFQSFWEFGGKDSVYNLSNKSPKTCMSSKWLNNSFEFTLGQTGIGL